VDRFPSPSGGVEMRLGSLAGESGQVPQLYRRLDDLAEELSRGKWTGSPALGVKINVSIGAYGHVCGSGVRDHRVIRVRAYAMRMPRLAWNLGDGPKRMS